MRKVKFPGLNPEQTKPVGDAIRRAQDAESAYTYWLKELAKARARAIDLRQPVIGYLWLVVLTFGFDTSLGFALIADAFDGMGPWGTAVAGAAAAAMAIAAVIGEITASHLYNTADNLAKKWAATVLGLVPAAGIGYVVSIALNVLQQNEGEAGAGIGAKLVVLGALALMFHLLLFLAGERVLIGWDQLRVRRNSLVANRHVANAKAQWRTHAGRALSLDHVLTQQMLAAGENSGPQYDAGIKAYPERIIRHASLNGVLDLEVFLASAEVDASPDDKGESGGKLTTVISVGPKTDGPTVTHPSMAELEAPLHKPSEMADRESNYVNGGGRQ